MTEAMALQARAAVLKTLLDAVKEEYDRVRGEAEVQLRDAYASLGVKAVEVRVPGCGPVATLTLAPKEAAIVPDPAGLIAWCKAQHPTEVDVETVVTESVKPAFMKALLARLVADADGNVIDTATGELIEWARVVPAGPPQMTMRFEGDGRRAIATAYVTGALTMPQILGLPAGATTPA